MRELECADTVTERWQIVERFFSAHGAGAINYGVMDSKTGALIGMQATMPADFMAHYVDTGLHEHDHLVQHMRESSQTLLSGMAVDAKRFDPNSGTHRMLQEIEEAGYNALMLLPVAGTHLGHKWALNFACQMKPEEFKLFAAEKQDCLKLAAHIAHAYLGYDLLGPEAPTDGWFSPENVRLTARERDVLTWLAKGLRNQRIADKMRLAPVTVNKHIGTAKRKLGARTREQAVAIALVANLIKP